MKRILKDTLNKLLGAETNLFLHLYHRWYKKPVFPSLNHALRLYADHHPKVFFVMIGANEGQVTDPLYSYIRLKGWKGILVEPQAKAFEKLKKSYRKNQGLIFEKAAVSDFSGQRPFFSINPEKGNPPPWAAQLSSFDKAIPSAVLKDYPDAVIESEIIDCVRLDELLKKHQIKQLDVLMIDAEGHDYAILRNFDLTKWQPQLIIFEHCHLSKPDFEATKDLLRAKQYSIYEERFNTIGYRDEALIEMYGA